MVYTESRQLLQEILLWSQDPLHYLETQTFLDNIEGKYGKNEERVRQVLRDMCTLIRKTKNFS